MSEENAAADVDVTGADDASRNEREQHGEPVDAVATAEAHAAAIGAEYAAFRAKVLETALREGERRNWCEEIFNVLFKAGFTEEELPKTHVRVRITREFRVKLPVQGVVSSLSDYEVVRYVRHTLSNEGLREDEYEITSHFNVASDPQ